MDAFKIYHKTDELKDLSDQEKIALINYCDFEIKESNRKLTLVDLQDANLCQIEEEEFDSLDDIIQRLQGAYFYDYFERDLSKEEVEKKR